MPIYRTLGSIPRKRHIAHRNPDGGVYFEQLMGNKGFTGPASLLYHIHMPTKTVRSRKIKDVAYEADPDVRVRLRHFFSERLPKGGSPTLDRIPMLFNNDCAMLFVEADKQDEHFYRSAECDEYVLISAGEGVLETQFGDLPFVEGDQLIIHRGILHRYRFTSAALKLLIVESRGYLRWPKRYRNEFGQIKEGAPFSERDIKHPTELKTYDEKGEFPLVIRQYGVLTEVILDHHPFDVVGWDGYYYPWSQNVWDFEPITGTIHQPPPIHQILEGDGFVLCNFMPRPFDFHPDAVPAPYYHSNVMSDEVLYYLSKDFMSRKGIEQGSITLHPDGLPHGPHPGLYEGSIGKERTDEAAVMWDTFRPLKVAKQILGVEDKAYESSWLE
ncbi:homogentisate 1,2-dioxygenase [bacterium]|nr:homogentisate 1,2-dioxygenase [bacterium]